MKSFFSVCFVAVQLAIIVSGLTRLNSVKYFISSIFEFTIYVTLGMMNILCVNSSVISPWPETEVNSSYGASFSFYTITTLSYML